MLWTMVKISLYVTKKKFQIRRPPQVFAIDLLSKKRTLMLLPTVALRYVRITILEFLDVLVKIN